MGGSATRPRDTAVDTFLTAALDCSSALDRNAPAFAPWRRASRDTLARLGLPQGKLETFKYTPVERFYRTELLAERMPSPVDVTTVPGVTVAPISAGGPLDARVIGHLDRHIDHSRHPLARLNTSLAGVGYAIHATGNARASEPIRIEYGASFDRVAVTRLLVVVEEGADVTLIESDHEAGFANRVCELVIAPGARVLHVRLQDKAEQPSWTLTSVDVGEHVEYRHRVYSTGGNPRRNDLHVRLIGQRAQVDLKGVFSATDAAVLDNQITVEHAAQHGTSRHRFHGVAARRGELTFNGRIHIHPGAAGSDAELRTASLLTDATARINSKPELEIYNDDVKCAHGATVGQLDEGALFYLRSRGIAEGDARRLLLQAFIAQCIDAPAIEHAARALFAELWS